MSHFTVLVIGDDIEKQLAPYQENNMGDCPKEYMQFTEDEDYDVDEETGKKGYWSNPNTKWDWYSVGGRWTGYFKLKKINLLDSPEQSFESFQGFTAAEMKNFVEMFRTDPEKFEKVASKYNGKSSLLKVKVKELAQPMDMYPEHAVGNPGIMTEPAEVGYADQTLKKYIDFEGMREESAKKAAEFFDKLAAIVSKHPAAKSWAEIRGQFEVGDDVFDSLTDEVRKERMDKARDYARNNPVQAALNKELSENEIYFFNGDAVEKYRLGREKTIQNARNSAISTYAVVIDGKWYEKGEMGWWGISSNEMSAEEWNEKFSQLLDSVSDDTMLTIVDCHI